MWFHWILFFSSNQWGNWTLKNQLVSGDREVTTVISSIYPPTQGCQIQSWHFKRLKFGIPEAKHMYPQDPWHDLYIYLHLAVVLMVDWYNVILVIFRDFCASWVVPGLDPSYIELWRWNPGIPQQYLSRRNLEEWCSCPVFKAWPGASIYFFEGWFFHGSCILWIDFLVVASSPLRVEF